MNIWLKHFGIRLSHPQTAGIEKSIYRNWTALKGNKGTVQALSQRKEFQRQLSINFVNDCFIDGSPFTQTSGRIQPAGTQSHRQGPSAAGLSNPAVVSCNWCHVSLPSRAAGQLAFDCSSMAEPTQGSSEQTPGSGPVTFQAKMKEPSPNTQMQCCANRGAASYSLPALSSALLWDCIL